MLMGQTLRSQNVTTLIITASFQDILDKPAENVKSNLPSGPHQNTNNQFFAGRMALLPPAMHCSSVKVLNTQSRKL